MLQLVQCPCLLLCSQREMCYVLFCMDCGVFSKAPQGLVGSPCNALILLPHSLPTHPTHPTTPAMAPHTLASTNTKCTTLQQESVPSAPYYYYYSRPPQTSRADSQFYLTSVSSLLPDCQHLYIQPDSWGEGLGLKKLEEAVSSLPFFYTS